jgi:hypothetical protein
MVKVESVVNKRDELKNNNYISSCSSFSQQQVAMGMRSNSTGFLEMDTHLGER